MWRSSSLRLLKVDSSRRMLLSAVRRVYTHAHENKVVENLLDDDESQHVILANPPATGNEFAVWSVRWLLSGA